ncbi:MAG: amidohydrolase family protein [Planctomycetaceae bacterium]|nr:amidohydrolase family protein [Planctomycetaceae bacterium]
MAPLRLTFAVSAALFVAAWGLSPCATAAPPTTTPVEGLRENTPAVFGLTNLRIVTEPGKVIEKGTIVLRDGVIEAVGADVKAPADARVIDLAGKTAYAGLIDAYSEVAIPVNPRLEGSPHWNAQVAPQLDVARHFAVAEADNQKLRGQGITARLVAPDSRVIKGQSIVASTGSTDNTRAILKGAAAQHFRLTISSGGSRDSYPNSPMGAVALARQTLLDADWYAKAWAAWKGNNQLPRPERNDALEALAACLGGNQPAVIDAANEEFFLRADRFAREFGLAAIIRGSGREYRRLAEIQATGRAVIVPVNFPQAPSVATIEQSLDVSLQQLMHWDHAPENAGRLDAAGVPIALTTSGLRDSATFLSAVRRAVERGLKPDSALKALTTTPAALFGLGDRLGKIAPGMIGNVVITDGDLFAKKTKLLETWVDGRRYELDKPPTFDVRGTWSLELTGADDRILRVNLKIAGSARQLTGTLSKVVAAGEKADEIKLDQIAAAEAQLSFRLDSKLLGKEGPARGTATISRGEDGKLTLLGSVVWPDGTSDKLTGSRTEGPSQQEKQEDEQKETKDTKEEGKEEDKQDETERRGSRRGPSKPETPALFAVNYPLGDFGRAAQPDQPKLVALKNATLWTCGTGGVVESGTLLIGEGKIVAAGKDVAIPDGAVVVDLAGGKHISPGIIDCHSHMATDGGVNESSQAITAEVRIGDFIDADDVTIYRQLAGGVTAANVLHGSANPIGGQNQVIKLRWGSVGEAMKFKDAPAGVKFALGENVKQSNWGERFSTRYPQTRMGVEQIIRDAFAAAIDYQKAWDRWNQDHTGLPPRRDLELEALAEVVQGRRWIHCHSYRQDEILALIRVCDDYKITIGSLQHILEGYKVADVMAKHGATGSSFSDWWAYKYEVIDAIPYSGALMHRQGIVVSFNSDDAELGRHLNHEAAKAVKYGGVPPDEALKFVTLNPARQLRIDPWVGSLEAGKHADFVVWSGPPLAVTSRCLETWIDGRKYFDREADRALRDEQLKMRAQLIRKVLESGQTMQRPGERQPDDAELWPRTDEFCAHNQSGRTE